MADSSAEKDGDKDGLRRSVRPNFAEDVGEIRIAVTSVATYQVLVQELVKKAVETALVTVFCLVLLKKATESDIEFEYGDCDNLHSELAELYSYSELDDFASNIQCWKVYADNIEIQQPFHFSSLPEAKKLFIMQDLCSRMESAEPDVRLASARILLYILQGAYLDFSDEEEVEAGVLLSATVLDKGTGGHERDCLCNAFLNAHVAYRAGAYQALCTLLMAEICEPFDCGLNLTNDGGRESKASSRGSRVTGINYFVVFLILVYSLVLARCSIILWKSRPVCATMMTLNLTRAQGPDS
ncbi:unnamed protein product [Nippostrongylus brasiliensis]|uniref:N1221 domain-containing protein n=1 Tax=Nippostrongylus brasiliensis TaxID=27835 RepID=A0A0N4YH09_NIPBR|nr:unnamed protein product [Nippostrongylus brasiliensis]